MSASQFTVYTSSDPGNGSDQPGLLTGQAGDLIRILDKCLVNGYTGKAAAGWTHPVATSGNIASYKQPTGAGLGFVLNDNGPNVTSTTSEAWATGWETVLGVGASVGSGNGQFPTPAQLLTTGHVVWRKSATANGTGRAWQLFADSTTFYLFIATTDLAGGYMFAGFGDFFSLKGSTDAYRCMLWGRTTENSAAADTLGGDFDQMASFSVTAGNCLGSWAARSFGGFGTSVSIGRMGDMGKTSTATTSSSITVVGNVQTPNGPDNSIYMAPLQVWEIPSKLIRGRFRGLYHVCHPVTSFTDGQTFQGSNDFAGKSFQIVSTGRSSGFIAIETSATVETN